MALKNNKPYKIVIVFKRDIPRREIGTTLLFKHGHVSYIEVHSLKAFKTVSDKGNALLLSQFNEIENSLVKLDDDALTEIIDGRLNRKELEAGKHTHGWRLYDVDLFNLSFDFDD